MAHVFISPTRLARLVVTRQVFQCSLLKEAKQTTGASVVAVISAYLHSP